MFRLSFDCIMDCVDMCHLKLFSPHHLVHYAHITLNDLHNLCGDIFIRIVRNGGAVVAVFNKFYCRIDGLEKSLGVDAGENEARLVERLGTLGRGADADCREWMADTGEERTLFGKGARVGYDCERVHLKAVVVVESQRLLNLYARIKLEPGSLETMTAAGVAAVENRHVILLGHCVDCIEKAEEVLLRVDVLLAVGRQQNVLALLETQTLVDVGRLDFFQILVQHLGHRGTGHVGALLRQAGVGQITAGMLGVGHVHIGDDVHDAAVRLLGQALVLAAVAGLHVEDGDVQPLRSDDGQAAVCVAQHQHGVGLDGGHELVALRDDVAHRLAQIRADGVHVDLGVGQLQVVEEHAVQVVVVVLAGVGQDNIKIFAGLVDDGGQTDDLRAGADDDEQFQLAVVFKRNAAVVRHTFLLSS